MNVLIILFFLSLLVGQIGRMEIASGGVVYLHDVMLPFLLLIHIVTKRAKKVTSSLLLPSIGFIAIAIVSLLVNSTRFSFPELGASSLYLLRWALYVLLYLIVSGSPTPKLWTGCLYSVGVGFALLGIVQYLFYPDLRNLVYLGWDPHYNRLFSTLLDPNFTGIFLVISFFLGLALRDQFSAHTLFPSQGILFIALLLTYSRSSYVAFVVGLVIWGILKHQGKAIGVISFIFLLSILILPKSGEGRDLPRTVSTGARIGSWQEGITLFRSAPLLGHGFNTLRFVRGPGDGDEEIPARSLAGLDSSLLFILATTGLVGLAAYFRLLGSMLKLGVTVIRERSLGASYVAAIGAVLTHSLFVNSLFYPWVLIWLWVMSGVVERFNDFRVDSRS